MGRAPAKVANERRQKIWLLMLKGHNPTSITKQLNVCSATVYKDIKFLTQKSREYIFDLARGSRVLLYQRAIEGISLTLAKAWKKFDDPKTPEKQKVSYLRMTIFCHTTMIELISNGPCVMALQDITNRAERLGIDNNTPYPISGEEQIRNYINKKYVRSSCQEFTATTADTDTDIKESESELS